MVLKIEKGIPMPRKRSNAALYPLKDMEVGDSFFAPAEKKASISAASYREEHVKAGRKFTIRKEGEGIRVWRIA